MTYRNEQEDHEVTVKCPIHKKQPTYTLFFLTQGGKKAGAGCVKCFKHFPILEKSKEKSFYEEN